MRRVFQHNLILFFLAVGLLTFSIIRASFTGYDQKMDEAKDHWAITTDGELVNAIIKLNKLIAQRNLLHALYIVNMEEIQDGILDSLAGAVTADPLSGTAESIKNVIKLGRDEIDESHLSGLFNESSGEVNAQLAKTDEKNEANNKAYNDYKTALETHNSSPSHSTSPTGRHTLLPKTPREYEVKPLTLPNPSHVLCLGGCNNRDERQWGVVRNRDGKIQHLKTSKPWGASWRGYEVVTIASHKEKCGARAKYELKEHEGNWFWHEKVCGEYYYKCNSSNTCPNASNHISDDSSSNTVSPSASLSGSSSASAGSSVSFTLETTTAFSSVYWYVASPGESGLGTNVETDTGSSSSTRADFSYTIPSSASSGDTYTITAYIYNYSDSSVYQTSYSVSVSGSSPPVVVDNTPNCSDCTSHCSSPCSCSNSGTCNGSVYTPPAPTPTPSSLVTCGACETSYDPNSSEASRHTFKTCKHCRVQYMECTPGYCPNNGSHESD